MGKNPRIDINHVDGIKHWRNLEKLDIENEIEIRDLYMQRFLKNVLVFKIDIHNHCDLWNW